MFRRLPGYFLLLASICAYAAPPNIILITVDTTRADRMGFLGSKLGLTPNLDAMAHDGVVFTRAYAQVPLTTPSHAAILTGTYPQFNHIADLGAPLAKDIPYLPDLLRRHGYHTAAFVGAYILDPKSAAPGFDRGFETYDAGFRRRQPDQDRYATVERRAGDVVNHALAWLLKHPQRPFFLWLHFYDPHDPYDPPAPYKARYAAEPYNGEIAYTDAALGKFLTALRARGLYNGAIIAVMADHGEAFGEHGEQRHGIFLYDETVHVPLLFKLPLARSAGRRIDTRVALADVAPTVLQLAALPVPPAMQGASLAKEMKRGGTMSSGAQASQPERQIYSETDYNHRAFGWSMLRSWRAGKYLYVQAPKRELYDQPVDPAALHNLADTAKAVTDTMDSQLRSFHDKTARAKTGQAKLNPEQAESLRALGYLASDSSNSKNSDEGGADPKDKVEIANLMHQALINIEEDDYAAAIPRFQQVIQEEPQAATAYLELGRAMVHLKQYQEALPILRAAAEKMPDSVLAHYELGLALVKTGQWEPSLPEFQAAAVVTPNSPQLHFYLAAVYTRLKRIPEATQEFQKTLQLDPNHYLANLLFGRMMFLEGHPDQALPRLQLAAKIEPKFREPHAFLADLYAQLGQQQKAARERTQAETLSPGLNP